MVTGAPFNTVAGRTDALVADAPFSSALVDTRHVRATPAGVPRFFTRARPGNSNPCRPPTTSTRCHRVFPPIVCASPILCNNAPGMLAKFTSGVRPFMGNNGGITGTGITGTGHYKMRRRPSLRGACRSAKKRRAVVLPISVASMPSACVIPPPFRRRVSFSAGQKSPPDHFLFLIKPRPRY